MQNLFDWWHKFNESNNELSQAGKYREAGYLPMEACKAIRNFAELVLTFIVLLLVVLEFNLNKIVSLFNVCRSIKDRLKRCRNLIVSAIFSYLCRSAVERKLKEKENWLEKLRYFCNRMRFS